MRTVAEHAVTKPDPYRDPASREFCFRRARFRHVRELIESILAEQGKARIIDLGGTEQYWAIASDFLEAHRSRIHITLVNPETFPIRDAATFASVKGDATALDLFAGEEFDLAHSNSVIEHVGHWQEMRRFAANMQRLGRRYYMQTPNFWFPLEPHFRFPGFQFLPRLLRVAMLQRMRLGFFRPIPDRSEASDVIAHHRLIGMRRVRRFFPDAEYRYEWVYGLPKSIMAVGGQPTRRPLIEAPSVQPETIEAGTDADDSPGRRKKTRHQPPL